MPLSIVGLVDRDVQHFWSLVDKTPTCWLWTAGKSHNGYGEFWVPSLYSPIGAHRVSWWIKTGTRPPKGLQICHKCDIRLCVRPSHLFLGDAFNNMSDASRKGRIAHGERQGASKLTNAQVSEARRLYASKAYNLQQLADMYHVHCSTIHRAITGMHWKHVA
jgi:hypothetical protein